GTLARPGRGDERIHQLGTRDLLRRRSLVARAIELRHRVLGKGLALDEPRAEARERRLPRAHRAERQVSFRHVIHPGLHGLRGETADARGPPFELAHELQETFEVPPVGRDTSLRLAALLALIGTELLHEVDEELLRVHGLGSPGPRATTALSPTRSIRGNDPTVKWPAVRERARSEVERRVASIAPRKRTLDCAIHSRFAPVG